MNNNDYYNDYYKDSDKNSFYSYDAYSGNYSTHLVVKPNAGVKSLKYFMFFVLCCMAWMFWRNFKSTIDTPLVLLKYSLLLLIPLIYVVLSYMSMTGKKFELNGNTATVTKMKILHEKISVNDIRYAELVTGLRTGGRRPHKDYNNLVIFYKSKSITFADIKYDGWREMVDYMDSIGKLRRIDGRSSVRKYIDDKFN